MRFILAVILWFVLLAMCWPLALLLIFVLPIVWLITLPFRIVGFTLDMVFQLIRGIFLLPFRLLGVKS
jgi:hypothetical protein